ncbi:MAG: nitrilase-related carbon-nitrogen hydrolase [Hyphomicrobiaceae bacterium]
MRPPPDRIRVAAAQYPIDRLPDLDALIAKHARWVGDAAARRADLMVFPEYGLMEIAGTGSDAVAGDLALSLEAVARDRARVEAALSALATATTSTSWGRAARNGAPTAASPTPRASWHPAAASAFRKRSS